MAVSMKSGVLFSGSSMTKSFDLTQQMGFSSSSSYIQFIKPHSVSQLLSAPETEWLSESTKDASAKASYGFRRGIRWWENTTKTANMVEINSAQEMVDTMKNASDRLVIIHFYSPVCGACRALHPKICELAESNPDVIFLKTNYEELKKMCHALHINVLPFFRFYKGSKGRLCSFSCTLSTIRKFRDALTKYNNTEEQSSDSDQAKGLDESELLRLTSMGEISVVEETSMDSQEVIKNLNFPNITEQLSFSSTIT